MSQSRRTTTEHDILELFRDITDNTDVRTGTKRMLTQVSSQNLALSTCEPWMKARLKCALKGRDLVVEA